MSEAMRGGRLTPRASSGVERIASPVTERQSERRSWVLVVDDTEANRYAVSRMLRAAGFEVSEAATGRQALRLAHSHPDLVVLDVNLPDMTGFDVVRELRAERETALIPVLHLSASYLRDEDRAQGLDEGANAYLTHPVEPTVFLATVRSLLRVGRAEEELSIAAEEWRATFDAISDALFVLEKDGSILRANRGAERLLRRGAEPLTGRDAIAALAEAWGKIDEPLLREAVRARIPVVHELSAGDRWFRIAVDPMGQHAAYRGSVVCVVSDITERKAAERERASLLAVAEAARTDAEEARVRADEANRTKSDFLATMSHEIRTPINAILGYAQILDMGIPGNLSVEQRAHLDRLRTSAVHLLGLVNEILDLAKVESGRLHIEPERATIDDALEAALALARPLAQQRGLTLVDECSRAHAPPYFGDPGRVRQILANLLSNAVKFTEPGGRITIQCSVSDGASTLPDGSGSGPWLMLSVVDTGIGIAADQLSAIFEPFVQAEMGHRRTHGGTGLGLTISRRLAHLMGGDLTAESEPGAGSRFTLWLPAAPEQSMVKTSELPAGRRRAAPYDTATLLRVGHLLLGAPSELAHRLVVRLRAEPTLPPLGGFTDAQLVNHFPTFVTELAQSLLIIAEPEGVASTLLRDGNAIRGAIAERHGAQRQSLGWRVEHVNREYVLIAEELERLIRARQAPEEDLDGAVGLTLRLVEQSKLASVRGLKQASGEQD